MSSASAIAVVTYLLRDLLQSTFTAPAMLLLPIDGTPSITAMSPARVPLAPEAPGLNLFLYQVTPNPAWRNAELPSHDDRGERRTNAPLALDLHFLLSAYGAGELVPEMLLGYAMQALHETPVLTRARINNVLAGLAGTGGVWTALKQSDLSAQVEQIRITPKAISADDMSKLWSSIQAPYRPSAAYHLSVVLIDRRSDVRATLPVLAIGPGRDGVPDGPLAVGGMLPPYPTVDEIVTPNPEPAIRLGETLRIRGSHLARAGVQSTVHFRHERTHEARPPIAISTGSPSELSVTIPNDPHGWQAGIYSVSVSVPQPNGGDRRSSERPLVIAPFVQVTAPPAGPMLVFDVTIAPAVRSGQRVSLIVGTHELHSEPIVADTSTLSFSCDRSDIPAGRHVVRVRVDGIDSLVLERDPAGVVGFVNDPGVTIA